MPKLMCQQPPQEEEAEEEHPILSYLDGGAANHHLGLGGGGLVLEGTKVVAAVRNVLERVRAPGANRGGLPKDALHSSAQRDRLASRIYPFAPGVSPEEVEQLVLLHAFEMLLDKAQPERKWCLKDFTGRERVPRELLAQTLDAAVLKIHQRGCSGNRV